MIFGTNLFWFPSKFGHIFGHCVQLEIMVWNFYLPCITNYRSSPIYKKLYTFSNSTPQMSLTGLLIHKKSFPAMVGIDSENDSSFSRPGGLFSDLTYTSKMHSCIIMDFPYNLIVCVSLTGRSATSWSQTFSVHWLAWPWCTTSPHSFLSFPQESEVLQSNRRRPHCGTLQVSKPVYNLFRPGIKLESKKWSQTVDLNVLLCGWNKRFDPSIAEGIKFNKGTLTKFKPKRFLQVRSFAPNTFHPKITPPPKLPGLIARARPPAQSQASVSTVCLNLQNLRDTVDRIQK